MKNLKLVLVLPAILLTACGSSKNFGTKISEEEGKAKLAEVAPWQWGAFNAVITGTSTNYNASNKTKTTTDLKVIVQDDNAVYFYSKVSVGSASVVTELTMLPPTSNYEDVIYVRIADGSREQKVTINSYNDDYYTYFLTMSTAKSAFGSIVQNASNPSALINSQTLNISETVSFKYSYYTNSETSFTLVGETGEKGLTGYAAVNFVNNKVNTFTTDMKMRGGSYVKEEIKFDFDASTTVDVPAGYNTYFGL